MKKSSFSEAQTIGVLEEARLELRSQSYARSSV
jgi:hypothetical protein